MSAHPPRVLLSAGETSGDRLGAGLAEALLRRRPDIELVGMGGPRMAAAGVRLIQDSEEVAVVGFYEVLARLPALRRAMARLAGHLERERPDVLVPIDFPDFNMKLAARARRHGVGVVYFVSPQVWAWRRGRVKTIRGLARRMLVLFPFEAAFYEQAGVPVTFVGHPVAEQPAPRPVAELCRLAGLDPRRPTLALMPGSRRGEIARHLAPMLGAGRLLQRRRPELQFLVPLAPGRSPQTIAAEIDRSGLRDVRLHAGDFPEILHACTAGVVASGTASLEAAVTGLPIVVVYRMHPVSYGIGRALVHLDDVALPNLVAGRRIVPELIQGRCTPAAIAGELEAYLDDPERAAKMRATLLGLRDRLGGPGVFDRAADALLQELDVPIS